MQCQWKPNWEQTKQHFIDWWNQDGFIMVLPYIRAPHPIPGIQKPGPAKDLNFQHTDPDWIARSQKYRLSRRLFLGDALPVAAAEIGSYTLSLYLAGAEPVFEEYTVWFKPLMEDLDKIGTLRFNPENSWYRNHQEIFKKNVALGKDLYFTGTAGLGCNIDILSAIRGPEKLMLDLIERPQWVKEKLAEINQAYFQAFEGLYDIYKLADGSSCSLAYGWWAPGKVAMVMVEAAAMISPEMFEDIVLPPLREQCAWLDHSVFIIDGMECLRFLDHLLSIEKLDAIALGPRPQEPPGDDPHWYDINNKILKAGKSLLVFGSDPEKAIPLLDNVGSAGVHLAYYGLSQNQAEDLLKRVESYY